MSVSVERATLARAVTALLEIFNAAYANFVSLAGLPVVTQQGRIATAPVIARHLPVLNGVRVEWLDLNIYKILQNLSSEDASAALALALPALTDLVTALIERYRIFLGRGVTLLFDKESRAQIVANAEFLKHIGAWEALPAEVRALAVTESAPTAAPARLKDHAPITLRTGQSTVTWPAPPSLLGVLSPREYPPVPDLSAAVRAALAQPLGTPRLAEMAAAASSAVIIVDDQTRPTPTPVVLPHVLAELAQANMPDAAITILVATGMHRAPTPDEMNRIVPPDIAARFRVVVHDCKDPAALVAIGKARSGVALTVNRAVAQAGIVIAIGMIAPHPYAGFTGGPKSISPGTAGLEAIVANHTLNVFPTTGSGRVSGNPVQEDIAYAGRLGRLAFVVNVALGGANQPVGVLAGDPFKVCEEGFELARRIYRCEYPAKSDAVVVSCGGHPRDATLYLAVRAVKTASAVIRRGGYIILVAGCEEETGPEQFAQVMRDMPRVFEEMLTREPEHVIAAHILKTTNTIVVSCAPVETFTALGLRGAATIETALARVGAELGRVPTVLVITNGWSVIPELGQ